jgi:hypothetical protein
VKNNEDNERMGEYILERGDAVDLTRNLCAWLEKNRLTCAVIHPNSFHE